MVYTDDSGTQITENRTISVQRINNVMDYFPYGKILREFRSGDEERYHTTQHERDVETGLDYRGARYYDSDVARFLSTDPLQTKYPAWSAYNYVMGNPMMLIDPNGKSTNYYRNDNSDKYDLNESLNDFFNKKYSTNWTEKHVYLNHVFGDPAGFNETISNKLTEKYRKTSGTSGKQRTWDYAFREGIGISATYSSQVNYYISTSMKDFKQTSDAKVTVNAFGWVVNFPSGDAIWDGYVKVYYGGKLYSQGSLEVPEHFMHANDGREMIGEVTIDIPDDPTKKVYILITVGYTFNAGEIVVNQESFLSRTVNSGDLDHPNPV